MAWQSVKEVTTSRGLSGIMSSFWVFQFLLKAVFQSFLHLKVINDYCKLYA